MGKLVWGLAAAITEFLNNLTARGRVPKERSIWMPVDGDCVVSGQISGPAEVGRFTWIFSFVSAFRFWISNSKRKLENRKDELTEARGLPIF
jgi:hypothetical protein